MDITKIRAVAERETEGTELFVVDVKGTPAGEVEVLIDSDASVSIESCAALSRAIEAEMDREEEDFQLTVSSAGIGQPLKVFRQYRKLIGRPVEAVLRSGLKIRAELRDATPDSITLAWEEMALVEGKKRKQPVPRVETYALDDVKSTVEYLDFK